MTKLLKNFWKDESGQGVPEYALILGGVVLIATIVIAVLAVPIQGLMQEVGLGLGGAPETTQANVEAALN